MVQTAALIREEQTTAGFRIYSTFLETDRSRTPTSKYYIDSATIGWKSGKLASNKIRRLVCVSFSTCAKVYCPPRDHNKELIDSLWATGWGEGDFLQEVDTNHTLCESLSKAAPVETWWVIVTLHVCVCVLGVGVTHREQRGNTQNRVWLR